MKISNKFDWKHIEMNRQKWDQNSLCFVATFANQQTRLT